MATFPPVRNNVTTTLRSDHASGDGQIKVQPGAGSSFGDTFPIRVTCVRASDNAVAVLRVSARSADDLTTSGAIEGTADIGLAAGDLCEMRLTAGAITEIQDNLLYTTTTPTTGTVGGIAAGTEFEHALLGEVLDDLLHPGGSPPGAPGGLDKQVQFNDGGSFGGDAGLTYDKTLKSLAQGGSVAGGQNSHAEGFNCFTYGQQCHAEGWGSASGMSPLDCTISGTAVTIAGGDYTSSFLVGEPDDCLLVNLSGGTDGKAYAAATVDSVTYSGGDTTLTLTSPVTDATAGKAAGRNFAAGCHAEGRGTATADFSHAEGGGTATATYSHAEGFNCFTSGGSSHAEGSDTTASGQSSHAEGEVSVASGSISHAQGLGSLASLPFQHACSDGGYAINGVQDIIPGASQYSIVCLSCQTTGGSPVNLTPGGGLVGETTQVRPTVRPNFTYAFVAYVTARKTDGTKHAHFIRQGMVSNEAGTTALVGPVMTLGTDFNIPGWSVAVTADNTHDALQFAATGEENVRWFARVDLFEVGS